MLFISPCRQRHFFFPFYAPPKFCFSLFSSSFWSSWELSTWDPICCLVEASFCCWVEIRQCFRFTHLKENVEHTFIFWICNALYLWGLSFTVAKVLQRDKHTVVWLRGLSWEIYPFLFSNKLMRRDALAEISSATPLCYCWMATYPEQKWNVKRSALSDHCRLFFFISMFWRQEGKRIGMVSESINILEYFDYIYIFSFWNLALM